MVGRDVGRGIVESNLARHAVTLGIAAEEDLHRISAGWLAWAAAESSWLSILHGEILCRARRLSGPAVPAAEPCSRCALPTIRNRADSTYPCTGYPPVSRSVR